MRGASTRDRALLIHRFSTALKAPVSSEITRLPGPSTCSTYSIPGWFRVPGALFERGFYFLITINGRSSIREGLLFEGGFLFERVQYFSRG